MENKIQISSLYGEFKNLPKDSEPSETVIPKKKQTVYLLMRDKSVKTEQGYVIELTNSKGYRTKIALLCKGKRWFATHYDTGLDCTPNTKSSGEVCLAWKRDELIAELKELDIDFEDMIKRDLFKQECIELIEKFKRSVQDQ